MAASGLGIILFRYADWLYEKGYRRNTIHLCTQAVNTLGSGAPVAILEQNYAKTGDAASSAISNAHLGKSRLAHVKLCLIPNCS
jgi:hypothetical protein